MVGMEDGHRPWRMALVRGEGGGRGLPPPTHLLRLLGLLLGFLLLEGLQLGLVRVHKDVCLSEGRVPAMEVLGEEPWFMASLDADDGCTRVATCSHKTDQKYKVSRVDEIDGVYPE